jgi:hypothetical protein
MTDRDAISDDMLMALADDELDAAEAARVRAAIAADADLARRFALFRDSRGAVTGAHAGALHEPVPERLLAAVRAADARSRDARSQPTAEVVTLRPRAAAAWRPLALAASVALALGGVVGFQAGRVAGPDAQPAAGFGAPGPVLAAALEAAPSGRVREFAGGSLIVLHTYPVPTGFCRDFALAGSAAGAPAMVGVACREDGTWRTRLVMVQPADGSTGGFRPAGSDDPLVGELLQRLQAQPPLSAADEAALLGRGWR